MRPYLIILIFLASTVLARYYEKTRFDRSVNEYEVKNTANDDANKQWSFTDDVTQFVAYKSKQENDCYLRNTQHDRNVSRKKLQAETLLYATTTLTKLEAWRLAGDRIVDFCNGRTMILLQETRPVPGQIVDPFFNEIPEDSFPRQVATDVVTRAKRQIPLAQRDTNFNKLRQRRQANQFRGKFRGQTQSQYLNFGNDEQKQGKAEAEATQQSSHAIVSGSRGIGQAQSMSSGSTGCEDCPGYPGIEMAPDKIRVPPTDVIRPGTGIIPGGVPYPGGVAPGTLPYPGGVQPGITRPGGDGTYPGGVQPGITRPGGDGTYPGGVQPGVMRPGGDGIYPGGVQPGVTRPGGDGIYPGGVQPGVTRPGGDGTYPGGVQPGITRPGGDGIYPGGVQPGVTRPGGDGTYPGGVQPGVTRPGGDGIYPGGVQPGVTRPGGDGIYPGGVQPGVTRPGGDGTYPGGVQPGVTRPGGDGIYPGGVQPDVTRPGGDGTYPGGVQPGIMRPGGDGTYPGGVQPGVQQGQGIYPPGVVTTVTTGTTVGVNAYPGGIAPGTGFPGTAYPGAPGTGTYPGSGVYPGSIQTGVIPGPGAGTYPGSIVPGGTIGQKVYPGTGQQTGIPGGTGQGVYPGQQTGVTYPGGIVPGTIVPGGGQIPIITTTDSRAGAGSQVITPGQITNGQLIYPSSGGITQVGRTDGVPGIQGTYPGTYPGSAQLVPGGYYPSQGIYPGGVQIPTHPGGQYPSTGGTGVPGVQYPIDVMGQTTGRGESPRGFPGQYPGGPGVSTGYPGRLYPGTGGTTGTGDDSQYYSQVGGPGGPAGITDDGSESQASSSVQQVDSGTQASASAQGKYGSGTAQSQVTGTYSGSGAFSAQAGTSDANKGAQTEVSGGKEGATSNAQGVAGYGKSQSQVQLDSDSGATSTGAQSSGWNHGTNSQVQASSKGGMADAQANGEGSTSSQAQIGFQPYLKNDDEKLEERSTPFRGSGTASAQSGTHRGQSQSQLQGSFQYGITYTGAAQAGSGSGAASSRKPFNFTDTELFKPFKVDPSLKKPTNTDTLSSQPVNPNYDNKQDNREQNLQSSSSRQTVVVSSKDSSDGVTNKKLTTTEKPQTDDATYDDYTTDDEYTDDDDYSAVAGPKLTIQEKISGTFPSSSHEKLSRTVQQQDRSQSQTIQVTKGNRYDLHVNQDSNIPRTGDILQPGQSVLGYIIPPGFRGRVTSTSGAETVAQGDGKSQSQTVSLVPKDMNTTKSPGTETRSLQTNQERYVSRHTIQTNNKKQGLTVNNQNASSDKQARPTPAVAIKPSYYTVTNSFAGKMNGSHQPRKYEHRYYTKSSTCGYFTFSCNVVYGSNGRTKICKPKVPTYPDGTPMKC
ncbi:uncharacterized protein LOC109855664 isoform X2 [Pseudomyrmex gracilis]|uniref:uncharacterized protein LOC109855664 isoform X2 n=1 Tax=Pseudomyrmex gracilis TaxID=219809 RepID=UPI000994966E|nr:uncharacterized protein LOC109855664 isoform X2 [Pseudomyrmex gracilis]